MIKILKSYDLESLETEINTAIQARTVKNVNVEFIQGKDYMFNGEICNQWSEFIAIILFET